MSRLSLEQPKQSFEEPSALDSVRFGDDIDDQDSSSKVSDFHEHAFGCDLQSSKVVNIRVMAETEESLMDRD